MIYIKRQNSIIYSTEINSGSKRKFSLMSDDYITLKFSLVEPIQFKLGDYVTTDFGRFEIVDIQKPSYNTSTSGYDYELKFEAYYRKWKNKIFMFNKEASWSLTSTLDVHLGEFLKNLTSLGYDYNGVAFQFSIDDTVENKSVCLTYDNQNMIDALAAMAEAWDCEYWITDNIIHFGRCEFGDAVNFDLSTNVETMTSSNSKTTYATRIYAFGSTRNLPVNYRPTDESAVVNGIVQKRLMLPVGTPYIDAEENLTQEEAVESVIVFDDIYPRRISKVLSVTSKEVTIEGEKCTIYYIKTDFPNFQKDYIISSSSEDKPLSLSFESGSLNGFDFKLNFKESDSTSSTFEIIRSNDQSGEIYVPNDTIKPKVDDTFVIYNIDATKDVFDGYITDAENELKTKAEEYVAKTKIDPNTYTNTMMCDKDSELYEIGERVNLINAAFFETGSRQSRIVGFEYNLDIPYDHPIYEVGEVASKSRLGNIESKIDTLTFKGQTYTGGNGSGVYLIRTNDSTPASNSNTFSAKRSLYQFVNRQDDNDVFSTLTFEELQKFVFGLISDNFSSGALGAGFCLKKDENGDSYLEIDRALFRKSATFIELIIQSLKHVGGQILLSPASLKCIKVEETDDSYKCFFKNDGSLQNEFEVDDLARRQTFNKTDNAYYWRAVTAIGDDYIELSKTDCDANSTIPQAGDDIVQLGNKTDVTRQNALILSAHGADSPCLKMYKGIDSYSLDGKELITISPSGVKINAAFFEFSTGKNIQDAINDAEKNAKAFTTTQIKATNDSISLKVKEELLYGRNLLIGASKYSASSPYTSEQGTDILLDDGIKGTHLDQSTEYCLQFRANIDITVNNIRIYLFGSNSHNYFGNEDISATKLADNDYLVVANFLEQDTDEFYVNIENGDEGVQFNAWNFKLEKGKSATAWSAAPEDLVNAQELLETGLDIKNKKIILTADETTVQTNTGKKIAAFTEDSDGNPVLNAECIDTKSLVVENVRSKNGSFSFDSNGNMIANGGSFKGMLQFNTAYQGNISSASLFHLPAVTKDTYLVMPHTVDQCGKVVKLFNNSTWESGGIYYIYICAFGYKVESGIPTTDSTIGISGVDTFYVTVLPQSTIELSCLQVPPYYNNSVYPNCYKWQVTNRFSLDDIKADGNAWYRKYDNGWLECGGKASGTWGIANVTFPSPFKSGTTPSVVATMYTGDWLGWGTSYYDIGNTGMKLKGNKDYNSITFSWEAKGWWK